MGESAGMRRSDDGVRRVWLLVALLTAVAVAGTAPLLARPLTGDDLLVGALLTLAVAVTERWSLNARIGSVSQRLTLSEVPLLLGLLAAPAAVLVGARLLGGLIALQVLRRQAPHKTAYNLTYLWLETLLVIGAVSLLGPLDLADGGRAAALAVVVAAAVAASGAAAMAGAMSAVEGRLILQHVPRAVRDGLPPTLATTAATTIAVVLAQTDPLLLWAPSVLLVVLLLAYRSHVGLLEAQDLQARLSDITSQVTGEATVPETVDRMIDAARTLMDAPVAAVRMPDDHGRNRWVGAGEWIHADLDHGVALLDGSHGPEADCCDVAAPVLAARIDAVEDGWLAVRFNERHHVGRSDARAIEMLANHASVAIANARRGTELVARAEEAHHLAHHDPLTGLPNRTALMGHLTAAIEDGRPFALLLIDLDNFKEINDALGHAAGDVVLDTIARRCADLDDEVVLGRLGGDEFLALVVGGEVVARQHADALREQISRTVQVGPYGLEVGSSVGVALHPQHGDTPGELLKHADLAMYEAKSRGSVLEVFGEDAGGRAMRQLAISSGFRRALAEDGIGLVFQPLIELGTGDVVGLEALARWHDPVLGHVNPEEFVRAAEQAGLIADLTDRVLDRTLGHLRTWQEAGLDLTASVNLSVRTLLHTGLTRMVAEALDRHGVSPSSLTLEITETAVLTDPQRTLPVLRKLARLGVSLAIDDFGTGYSSLAYLRQLPADEVKVDKSFVIPMASEPGADRLVGGIVRLCQEMGFRVVAEGVEDDEVRGRLADMGCELAQGFGIARPMPPAEVPGWVRAWQQDRGLRVIGA